jgi:uncharacterized protein (DUF302 family)
MTTVASYGFGANLRETSLDAAVTRVTEALKAEGFGVLTTIDVQDTLKKRMGAEVRPYVILGACNPQLAHRALDVDPHVGLLLPCNVVVREVADGQLEVALADPTAMFTVVNRPELAPVAIEAEARLRRVVEALAR